MTESKTITYKSSEISFEILLKPQLNQLLNKLKSFFTQPSPYHHIIYAGSFVRGSGKWLLSDATFSVSNLMDVFKSSEVVTAIKDGSLKKTLVISCKAITSLNNLSKLHPNLNFKLNPSSDKAPSEVIGNIGHLVSQNLTFPNVKEILEESSVVGSIRFYRPTIYIFPAGLGASCLFGVSGFNLLVDGGFVKKSCFWDFAKHLERIDALILTHFGEDNLFGVLSALERKRDGVVNPDIGYVFANCIRNTEKLPQGEGCEVDVGIEGARLVDLMREVGVQPQRCIGSTIKGVIQPLNLYHKLGHGSLDLYVLNPMQDSRSLKEFLASWSRSNNPFASKPGTFPLSSLSSVCAVVVWQPPQQPPTRLLFPGTTPQQLLLESLDRLSNISIFDTLDEKSSAKKVTPRSSATTGEPRSSGPKKSDSRQKIKAPFHVDMAYIPSHGDHRMVDKDFFMKVRARYYVLSSPNPSSVLLTNLLEVKESWEGDSVVIPTHDTDTLRFWVAAHHQQLSNAGLSISPAANRCTIQLEDHHTSCAAYRLEF